MIMKPSGEFYALYLLGSRVYKTNHSFSDWDYIGIKDGANLGEMDMGLINLKVMSPEHFQGLLFEHSVSALEALFLPEDLVIQPPVKKWKFKLSLSKLRHSFSQKSNNSFVKAKKKFESPYDWARKERERGKKSLFHSLRILKFGIQIAKHGTIINYSEANDIFEEISYNSSTSCDDYKKRWKPEFNSLATEFRKLAPKE